MTNNFNFDRIIERRGTGSIKWDSVPADVIPMWVADMDFPAPPPVIDALRARLDHPIFGYTHVEAAYLEAFSEWQKTRNNWTIPPREIVPAPGVMPAVRFAIDAFTRRGDGVIVQPPVYFPFYRVVEGRHRVLIRNRLRQSDGVYRIDADQLDALCAAGARMLIICSPHNPVARVWSEEELLTVARICARHDVIVISDEIHSDIIMPGIRFVPFIPIARRIGCRALSLTSASKTFNIAGLASCTVVASDESTEEQFRETLRAGNLELPNLLSIVAATAAYAHAGVWLDELLPYLHENQLYLKARVEHEVPGVRVWPVEGTYIAWVDFRETGLSDIQVEELLRTRARVRLNEGRQFGDEGSGFQRINFATPRLLMEEGISRIAHAFRNRSE